MLKDLHRRLRPMGIADILDETAELYKRNFLLLMGISAVIWVPVSLILGGIKLNLPSAGSKGSFPFLEMGINMLVESIVTGALTLAISERYLERATSTVESYKAISRNKVLFPLIVATFLKNLIVLLPIGLTAVVAVAVMTPSALERMSLPTMIATVVSVLSAMLIGFVWAAFFGVKLGVVEPAVVLERKGAWKSMGRSWNLIGGHFWRAFGILIIAILFVTVVSSIVIGPTSVVISMRTMAKEDIPRWILTLHAALGSLAQLVVGPVSSAVTILLYYDLRIRKEGFDLELLAKDLDDSARKFEAEGASSLPEESPAPPPEEGQS